MPLKRLRSPSRQRFSRDNKACGQPRVGNPCAGFSLLEVLAGMVFMTIGLLGFSALLISSEKSNEVASQEFLVASILSDLAESIRSTPFRDIATNYQNFNINISQINGTGTVTLFLDETDSSRAAQAFGMPRDLDGDGLANQSNVAATYGLLPVEVEITWSDSRGAQTRSLRFLLSQDD